MKIRSATADDVQELASVYIAAFKNVDPSERWTDAKAAQLIRFFLSTQPDLAFVAETNGQILGGICGIAKPWWDGHRLVQTEIFIDPHGQKQGVGSKLFHHLLTTARSCYNVTGMESITFKDLAFPSSWYVKLGFEDKGDWKIVFGDTEVLLEKLNKKI